jgi:hypothetical protein
MVACGPPCSRIRTRTLSTAEVASAAAGSSFCHTSPAWVATVTAVRNAASIADSSSAGEQVVCTWPAPSRPRWASGTVVVDSVIDRPCTRCTNAARSASLSLRLSRSERASAITSVSIR